MNYLLNIFRIFIPPHPGMEKDEPHIKTIIFNQV